MADIGVSMRQEALEHKKSDGMKSDGCYCYWEMPMGVPDDVVTKSKLWVANRGRWVGYFVIHHTTVDELWFYSETWHASDGGPRAPFQGFTRKVPGASG